MPKTEQEFNELEFVQTFVTRWENRFLPIDMKFETDEYGLLPEFRIGIITTSKRMIPKKVTYVSNFKNITLPKHEYIPNNVFTVNWKNIEKTLVEHYYGYNLRQYEIYLEK